MHPEDARLFDCVQLAKLRLACEEAGFLLGRGYAQGAVLDVVGNRHQLEARQRLALSRCMCSEQQWQRRQTNRLEVDRVRGRTLEIDGFNLIIGVEVAVSGGLLLCGSDGVLRDLAGLRGSYRVVDATERALSIIFETLAETRPSEARFFLDAPVSNSGVLRARILERRAGCPSAVSVEIVPNADRELSGRQLVVSGDSVVIDAAESWVNLLPHIVRTRVPEARVIDVCRHDAR